MKNFEHLVIFCGLLPFENWQLFRHHTTHSVRKQVYNRMSVSARTKEVDDPLSLL